MKIFLKTLVLSVFAFYWSITLIFTLPDNYINVSLYKYSQVFTAFFFQRWAFFAPPPNFNDRLYYSYINKNDSTVKTFEVLEVINEKKSANAPFNWNADIEDYILSNSVVGVSEIVFESQRERKFDDLNVETDSTFQAGLDAKINQSSQFTTLKNYGKVIAAHNLIDPNQHDLIISLSRVDLPKFADRYENKKATENLCYRSDFISLN